MMKLREKVFLHYYQTAQKVWKNNNDTNESKIKPNQFNVIYSPEPGALYLDLEEDATIPVLCSGDFGTRIILK